VSSWPSAVPARLSLNSRVSVCLACLRRAKKKSTYHDVVLGSHVVGDVVVEDESQQPVEQREVDLLEDLVELGLEETHALVLARVPNVVEVVDAAAELVHQHRRGLRVARLDPVGEQTALVRLVVTGAHAWPERNNIRTGSDVSTEPKGDRTRTQLTKKKKR